jgi:hypothetical protein
VIPATALSIPLKMQPAVGGLVRPQGLKPAGPTYQNPLFVSTLYSLRKESLPWT